MASKKNKNNPDNKSNGINGNGNSKDNIKQNKLISSEHCEKNCLNVNECQKYKNYLSRMVVLHKVGKGLLCDK